MVNNVLNSISKALYGTFGDTHHYYVEDIEQKAKLPCFTIGVLNPQIRSVNRKDYYWTVPCIIHHFSEDTTNEISDTIKKSYAIGDKVIDSLEYLNIGGRTVRAENMSYTMAGRDALQIFITYRFWTEKPETLDNMEDLENVKSSVGTN